MRRILEDQGYVEVETPMLTPLATGAAARPFKTHHNALGIPLYARIAPELYLKRLTVGGFEKVYELNRNFRNEGISTKHNPEFTMLEYYWAYADVNQMMDLHEEMMRSVVYTVLGHTHVRYGENDIDFSQPFQRMTMKEAIAKYWSKSTPTLMNLAGEELQASWFDDPVMVASLVSFQELWIASHAPLYRETVRKADGTTESKLVLGNPFSEASLDDTFDETVSRQFVPSVGAPWKAIEIQWKLIQEQSAQESEEAELRFRSNLATLFELVAERYLINPTFITDFPKIISPLSKASPADPSVAERFEYFVGGLESANGFSELNDPQEQYERFKDQAALRERGDEEAMVM